MPASLNEFLAATGVALVAYAKTYAVWMQEKVQEHLFEAEELAKVLDVRAKSHTKRLKDIVETAKAVGGSAVFKDKESDFRFTSERLAEEHQYLREIAESSARLEVAVEKQRHYRRVAKYRRAESAGAFILGVALLVSAACLMARSGRPNKAPDRTAPSVTPPAAQESRH